MSINVLVDVRLNVIPLCRGQLTADISRTKLECKHTTLVNGGGVEWWSNKNNITIVWHRVEWFREEKNTDNVEYVSLFQYVTGAVSM